MRNEIRNELPYEENHESFSKWFREAAKEKWEKYLKNDESGISMEESDSMRDFLVEYGTEEEVLIKLKSFNRNKLMLAAETLLKEIRIKRPDLKINYYP